MRQVYDCKLLIVIEQVGAKSDGTRSLTGSTSPPVEIRLIVANQAGAVILVSRLNLVRFDGGDTSSIVGVERRPHTSSSKPLTTMYRLANPSFEHQVGRRPLAG
jgi:hypothetical protein